MEHKRVTDVRSLEITVGEYNDFVATYYRAIGKKEKIMVFRDYNLSVRQVESYIQTMEGKRNETKERIGVLVD